jgi:hypothetical protein
MHSADEPPVALPVQLATQVGELHACGLVHTDLKPDNVLVDLAPGSSTVVALAVADFGSLALLGGQQQVCVQMGTHVPEQACVEGELRWYGSTRSDLYCLGRTLLESLLGPCAAMRPVLGPLVPCCLGRMPWADPCPKAVALASYSLGAAAAAAAGLPLGPLGPEDADREEAAQGVAALLSPAIAFGALSTGSREGRREAHRIHCERVKSLLHPSRQAPEVVLALARALGLVQSLLAMRQGLSSERVAMELRAAACALGRPRTCGGGSDSSSSSSRVGGTGEVALLQLPNWLFPVDDEWLQRANSHLLQEGCEALSLSSIWAAAQAMEEEGREREQLHALLPSEEEMDRALYGPGMAEEAQQQQQQQPQVQGPELQLPSQEELDAAMCKRHRVITSEVDTGWGQGADVVCLLLPATASKGSKLQLPSLAHPKLLPTG